MVFLLSYSDVLNTEYGFENDVRISSQGDRSTVYTDYSACKGLQRLENNKGSWFLRTSGYWSNLVCFVEPSGYVGEYGSPSEMWGIRPALILAV